MLNKLGLLIPENLYENDITLAKQKNILSQELIKITQLKEYLERGTFITMFVEGQGGYNTLEIMSLVTLGLSYTMVQHQFKKLSLLATEVESRIGAEGEAGLGRITQQQAQEMFLKHSLSSATYNYIASSKLTNYLWGNQNNKNTPAEQDATELSSLLQND